MLGNFLRIVADAEIQLPGFQGVVDMFNSLLNSSLFSNYIFWYLGIGLLCFVMYSVIRAFRS